LTARRSRFSMALTMYAVVSVIGIVELRSTSQEHTFLDICSNLVATIPTIGQLHGYPQDGLLTNQSVTFGPHQLGHVAFLFLHGRKLESSHKRPTQEYIRVLRMQRDRPMNSGSQHSFTIPTEIQALHRHPRLSEPLASERNTMPPTNTINGAPIER
jgi:hypothetical protein